MFELEKDYKKEQEEISKALKIAQKKSDSKILKDLVKENEGKKDKEVQRRCDMVGMLVHEMLEQYEEGEMTFSEAVEDLYKALKQV